MYINNCQVGINAQKQSNIIFDGTASSCQLNNISNTAIALFENSILKSTGISGNFGSSYSIYNSDIGLYLKNSSAYIQNSKQEQVRFACLITDRSYCEQLKSNIIGAGITNQISYGVFVDVGSVCKVYETLVSGFTGNTGGRTGCHYASINYSQLYVGTTTQETLTMVTNTLGTRDGYVIYDPMIGNSIAEKTGVGTIPGGGGVPGAGTP